MFQIKICGVTRPSDADTLRQVGADAIGLNFYAKSPRCLDGPGAAGIRAQANGVSSVGVFVNASAAEINGLVARVPLDVIQLHGDEPTSLLSDLPVGVPVIRAVRMGDAGLAPVADLLEVARRLGRPYAAVLVDAAAPKSASGEEVYGGSGLTTDWARVRKERPLLGDIPLILAGGLTPANVAEAVHATHADGVDTASGVESSPGIKDPAAVEAFVRAARRAFEQIDG